MAAIQGDWYASRSTHDGEGYPAEDSTVRFVYATQPTGEKYIVAKVWSGDDGDYESTARLVAAAPELLAALKLLRDPDGDGQWPCYCDDPHFEGGMCENCVATAAIAKAEGRSE